ncbi:MAG: ribonuclease HI [Proteobacteria bacterium]|nr:ribonuclease HI [Pseudomonadota bacterium]
MKYEPDDNRIYSPNIKNLTEVDDTERPDEIDDNRSPEDLETIVAYTDGACIGNPGPAGLGYVITFPDGRQIKRGEPLGQGTNNIAELTAIARVLDLIERPTDPVVIHTDSKYAIGVLILGWKAKANQKLIHQIKKNLARFPRLELRKVKGHAGVPENELVDDLARNAAKAQTLVES